jgi:hypothetical protein
MLIPDNITDFESKGEQLLYFRFKNDKSSDSFYVLHSVFTNFHLRNKSGELDFLVLVPGQGIFAIEVKHGRVWRSNGTWNYQNRHGKVTSNSKSPISQVNGTMHSIRTFILSKLKKNQKEYNRFYKFLFGFGIAFTSQNEFVDYEPEAHSWQILNREGMSLPISEYINSLSRGWHNKENGKPYYDANLSRPTDADCKKIIQILRGDFEIDYTDLNRIIDNDYLIEEFTKEQFSFLDFIKFNPRCLVKGNAGTGKTLMALEAARRQNQSANKIALFCFNNQLGKKLKKSCDEILQKKNAKYFAGTFHSFLLSETELELPLEESKKSGFYKEILPFEFLLQNEELAEVEKFDYLILDEVQDLITPYYLEVFDLILKGGLENGNWVFFGDFSNQAIYFNNPTETIKILNDKSNFTNFPPLKINCRNTKKISTQNTLLTGVEKPEFTSRSIDGKSIHNKFPIKNKQLETIENILIELSQKKISFKNITLLSPKKFEKTYLVNSKIVTQYLKGELTFSTIHSFKGLENSIIILFDFEEITSDKAQRLLYVGISRARQDLYLILDYKLEQDYSQLIADNWNKIL